MADIRKSLVDSTKNFNHILHNVFQDYQHQEQLYQYAHQILNTIKTYMESSSTEAQSAVLTLGKTGWGKSTVVNFLDGMDLIPTQRGNLVVNPENTKPIKTQIADGQSNNSTTMAPRFCQTVIGNVCDLPGDEDTGGPLAEIINSIAKKNIGKKLRRIKILLVIPESVLGPQGNYGRGLKDILEANDKFLNGINRFKNNMMIIISFASRRSSLRSVYEKINKCLDHEDGALNNYRELISQIINGNRIKLFPKPSDSEEVYSIPAGDSWNQHKRQQIVREILQLPSRECTQKDFSVPENNKMSLMIQKISKVLLQKMKSQIQNHFDKVVLSGIQLNFAKEIFIELKRKATIEKFLSLYSETSFLEEKKPNLDDLNDQIRFLTQFLVGHGEEVKENWISNSLDKRINKVVDSIQMVSAQRGGSFRYEFDNELLQIRPNSQQFYEIKQEIENLKNLQIVKQRIEVDRRNNESQFYENYVQKVYDKTIEVPYEFEQKFVAYENQERKVQVPKNVEYDMPIQRDRIQFKDQTQKFMEKVPKVRYVTKTMNVPITTQGGRRYFLFGPREKYTSNCSFNYQTAQIYYEDEQKTRQVSKPYTEAYTDYIKANRVEFEEKTQIENVAVEKERIKVVQVEKEVYKEEDMKKFNEEKFEQSDAEVIRNINGQRTIIKAMIEQACHGLDQQIMIPEENVIENEIEENYKDLLLSWQALEYKSWAKQHPLKSIELREVQ